MKKLAILLLTIIIALNTKAQPSTIHVNNQDLFINGINIAWFNFASDLESFNSASFTSAITKIHAAGGNAIRWWIHTDGTVSPTFKNDSVSSISTTDLKNLNTALNIAYKNGVLIDICLWSFDMLQSGKSAQVVRQNKKLLMDSTYTAAYIRNALIPMVKYLKGNKGILCYEIFNEPEGMISGLGWTPDTQRVSFLYVQRFINRTAGAIHRTDTSVLVSSGSQLISYCSDVAGTNYYRNDRLIAAGGDSLGTLDYYMVHYYTSNGTQYSLFRKPASYWKLDKPIVIGEFPAIGFISESPVISPLQAYNYAFTNGYAGAQAWTYSNGTGGLTGGDKNGGLPDCAIGLKSIAYNSSKFVNVIPDTGNYIYPPYIVKPIPEGISYLNSTDTVVIGNLNNWFSDKLDSANLTFKVDSQKTSIANIVIDQAGNLKVKPVGNNSGIFTTTITATNKNGKTFYAPFTFSVIDTTNENKILFSNVYTSSIESNIYSPSFITDTAQSTFFSTTQSDNQWILFKLYNIETIQRLLIHWDNTYYAKKYEIKVSTDSINWQTVYTESNITGGYDKILFDAVKTKYILINCLQRATSYDYKIYSASAYSTKGAVDSPPYIVNKISDFTIIAGTSRRFNSINTVAKDDNLGEKLSYNFTMEDGSPLPTWMTYTDSTFLFKVAPALNNVGSYNVMLTVSDLFKQTIIDTFVVTVKLNPNAINTISSNEINVYPNPSKNVLKFSSQNSINSPVEITICDFSGKILLMNRISSFGSNCEINLSNIPTGIYILQLKTIEGIISKKVEVLK